LKRFVSCLSFLTILFAGAALHAQNTLTTNPNVVFLNATVNGGPVQVPVSVSSAPMAVISVAPSTTVPWLTFAASSSTTPSTISFIGNPSGLAAGVYNTVVSLSSPSATTQQVVVVLTVNSASPLISNPTNLVFNFSQGGALPGAQSLTITSSAVTPYTVSGTTRWLLFGGVNGQTPGTVTVGVDPTTLTAGTAYVGAVTLTPANNQPALLVPVVLFVSSSPALNVSGPLTFNFQIGGTANVTQKPLTITASSGTLGFSAVASVNPNPGNVQWLSVSPTTGTTPATLMVTVAPATLPVGTYIGTVTLNSPSASNASQNVQVTLNVSTQPLLDLSPNSLSYTYQVGGAVPPDQTVTPNATAASLNYTIAVSTNNTGSWLSYVASGVTPAPVTVSVNPVGLPPGNYTGSLTFNAVGGGNNPQVVQVTLSISNNPTLSASPGSLVFNFQTGQGQPAAQVVSVTTGGSPLGFTVSSNIISTSNNVTWLLVGQPSAATTPATFTVAVAAGGMAPGTYTGTVVLTAPGVSSPNPSPGCNGTLCIPVTLNISNTALLSANPNSLSFASQLGNTPNPTSVTVNSTGEAVTFTATTNVISPAGGTWLTLGGPIPPASSAAPSTFFVGITSQTLPAGVYKATITLHPSNGNPDVVIPVTLSVSLGNLTVSPTTLSFTQAGGGNPPPSQTINVGSTGAILAFTAFASNANWITVSSGSGATPGQVTVSVNGASLQPGNYSATVNIVSAGAGNSPQTVTVNLTVGQGTNLSVSPNTVSFASQFGGSAPSPQTVALTLGAGSSTFTATASVTSPANGTWLRVSPPNGTVNTTATNLIISADQTGLNPGTYNGSVTVTASGASNSPVTIPVSYTVTTGPVTGGGGTKILPQVAFGGGWYTSLYFTNTNTSAVSFTVSFFNNDARPLNVPSLGGSVITVNLPARGTAILEAPDVGALNQGYAVTTLPTGVTGNGVFRQTVDRVPQEAVVPLSGNTATNSIMVFDETNYISGVAVVAIGPTDTTVIVTLRDNQGNVIGNGSIPLAARNKTQFRLRDLPGMSGAVGRLGSVEFSVNAGNVAVLGLRFNGTAFTSIPTLDR
jgi:hypothetical protein